MNRSSRSHSALSVVAMAAATGSLLVSCAPQGSGGAASDDGAALTMWARSDGVASTALVEAYNATHDDQIKLTIIPGDTFQQKVGAAAGSGSLPDILAVDVGYSPNYVEQGLFLDITDRVVALPFFDDLARAHSEAASKDGKIYGVPHVVDTSLILYNKDLYRAAGLDPEQPPTSFDEMYAQAKAVRALGDDTYGFYFTGNCAGCSAYTLMPYLVAAGEAPLSADGTEVNLDTQSMREVTDLYQRMLAEDIAPAGAASETGTTWDASFQAGKIGILPGGSFSFLGLQDATFEWGVTPLMAPDGSASSGFIGGDVIGVTSGSNDPEAAWDFIEWSLEDEAQVEVIAKNQFFPSRVDLADNKYSAEDPRVVATIRSLADGFTPKALPFGEVFYNNNGSWLTGLRAIIVNGEDPDDALATMERDVQDLIVAN